jgi:predicted HNH restriction endonuclease
MGKRLESTPRSIVRHAIRAVWMRSRERSAAIKAEGNTCEECNRKGSKAKGREVAIEVHHLDGARIEQIVDAFYSSGLLCDPARLLVLCKDCHKTITQDRPDVA